MVKEENTDSKFTGLFSVDYSDKYGDHLVTYGLRQDGHIAMGRDRMAYMWVDRNVNRIQIDNSDFSEEDIIISSYRPQLPHIKFIVKDKIYKGVDGTKINKGLLSEAKTMEDDRLRGEILDFIANDLKSKDRTIYNVEEYDHPTHTGYLNNKRDITFEELFTVRNFYSDNDYIIGAKIADNILKIKVTNTDGTEELRSINISNKFCTTHSPIHKGILNVPLETIKSAIFTKTTREEDVLLDNWHDLFGTRNNIGAYIPSDDAVLDRWYYIFLNVNLNNIKNYIVNSYGSGYYYVVESRSGNLLLKNITDYVNEFKNASIDSCLAYVSHSMLAIIVTINGETFLIELRRDGKTSFCVSHTHRSGYRILGTRINDLKDIKFNTYSA